MKRDDTEQNNMNDQTSETHDPEERNENVAPSTPVNSPGACKIPFYPKRPGTPIPYLGRDKGGHHICGPSFSARPIEEQRRVSQLSEELRNDDDRHSRLSFESIRWSFDSSSSNSSTIVGRSSIGSSTIGRNSFDGSFLGNTSFDDSRRSSIETIIRGRDSMDSVNEEPSPYESEIEERTLLGIPILGRGSMESVDVGPVLAEHENPSESTPEDVNSTTEPIAKEPMSYFLGSSRMESAILGRILNENIFSIESSYNSIETEPNIQRLNLNDSPMFQRTSSPCSVRERRILRARRNLTPYTRSSAAAEFRAAMRPRGTPILGRQPAPEYSLELVEGENDDLTDPDYLP